VTLSWLGPVWFAADYRDVDRVRFTTDHYWQFVTDDMQFRLPASDGSSQGGNFLR